MARPTTQLHPPFGVLFFGVGLITTSLMQIQILVDSKRYWHLFSELPPLLITIRYTVSWIARMVGLVLGIGILLRRRLFRKVMMALAFATILVTPWKHPYQVFVHHINDLTRQSPAFTELLEFLQRSGVALSTVTWIVVIVMWMLEIILASLLLWYFSRPHVKAWFASAPSQR